MKKGSDFRLALFDSYLTVTQSSQSVPHRSRGLISHRGQVMRIVIQGHGYGGVSEKLLHDLRMRSPAKEQRGAGVPQVVPSKGVHPALETMSLLRRTCSSPGSTSTTSASDSMRIASLCG
jgi:hypothetical protein